jgi:hypothetical protein
MNDKRCNRCKQRLPLSAFNKDRATKDGLNYDCRGCSQARAKAYYAANCEEKRAKNRARRAADPERHNGYWKRWAAKSGYTARSGHLKRKYGITEVEYAAMVTTQGGLCAICRQPETMMRNGVPVPLSVDHDHVTGEIRQLLCYLCNTAVAMLREDPELARRVAAYLEEHHGLIRLAADLATP